MTLLSAKFELNEITGVPATRYKKTSQCKAQKLFFMNGSVQVKIFYSNTRSNSTSLLYKTQLTPHKLLTFDFFLFDQTSFLRVSHIVSVRVLTFLNIHIGVSIHLCILAYRSWTQCLAQCSQDHQRLSEQRPPRKHSPLSRPAFYWPVDQHGSAKGRVYK